MITISNHKVSRSSRWSFGRILIWSLLLAVAEGPVSTLVAQQPAAVPFTVTNENTYAVVIGISNYQDPAIPALSFADHDATAFTNYLKSDLGGRVPASNIQLLTNTEASIAAIYNRLQWLQISCSKGDRAIIYFSGHGDVEIDSASITPGYLLAYNSPSNNYRNNAIALEDLNDLAHQLTLENGAEVVLITDACHSGKLAGDFNKGRNLVGERLQRVMNDEVRITACAPDQLANEGTEWGGGAGAFSFYFLQGLSGFADLTKDGTISLEELSDYMDSCFLRDPFLKERGTSQNPLIDGNPDFKIESLDQSVSPDLRTVSLQQTSSNGIPSALKKFPPLAAPPIDLFFAYCKKDDIESRVDFRKYLSLSAEDFGARLMADLSEMAYADGNPRMFIDVDFPAFEAEVEQAFSSGFRWKKSGAEELLDQLKRQILIKMNFLPIAADTLQELSVGLIRNSFLNDRFNLRYVEMVHAKVQSLINRYLRGDLDELKSRQYYGEGLKRYENLIAELAIAIKLTPRDHYLYRILEVQLHYLSGLRARLLLASSPNQSALLKTAFSEMQMAAKLEPYAAYIDNELGNLYLFARKFDEANAHFKRASILAPEWAIPWSNRIRYNLAVKNWQAASRAAAIADSLQPDIPYVLTNIALLREREGRLLEAESYFRRAFSSDSLHYLPAEHLGSICLANGRISESNTWYRRAADLKERFFELTGLALNDDYFDFGLALGVAPAIEEPHPICKQLDEIHNDPVGEAIVAFIHSMNTYYENQEPLNEIGPLQAVLKKYPNLPLVSHYIGLLYYMGNNTRAIEFLERAEKNFLTATQVVQKLDPKSETDVPVHTTCLALDLSGFAYDFLDDYYMLGKLYEEVGRYEEALAQYRFIAAEESKRLYANGGEASQFTQSLFGPESLEFWSYGHDVYMTGAHFEAFLLEKMNKYEEAETVLRDQAVQSIDLQLRTLDFYDSMLVKFPRDFYWQQKSGLFIYDRLRPLFPTQDLKSYPAVRDFLTEQFSVYPANRIPGRFQEYTAYFPSLRRSVQLELPVFKGLAPDIDLLFMALPQFKLGAKMDRPRLDPIKSAISELEASIRLSGNSKIDKQVASALADLYKWQGDSIRALYWQHFCIRQDPANLSLRGELAAYADQLTFFPEAMHQLDSIQQQGSLSSLQSLQLAEYRSRNGDPAAALHLLGELNGLLPMEEKKKDFVKAICLLQQKKWNQATAIILKLSKQNPQDPLLSHGKAEYLLARIQAMEGQKDHALQWLSASVRKGFEFPDVLLFDPAFGKLKNEKKWIQLLDTVASGLFVDKAAVTSPDAP